MLSLVFAAGRRPSADDIAALAARERSFSISHRPAGDASWLELLVNGLTFDLAGLAPAGPAQPPPIAHWYGVADRDTGGEALSLAPGPHLAGGRAMPPVIRAASSLAVILAKLAGVGHVCWHAARNAVGSQPFIRSVSDWLAGGAFPALGLTSIFPAPDRAMRSEGLSLFTGQELRLEPGHGAVADDAKLAVRLIDRLVAHGRVTAPATWTIDPAGTVQIEPAGTGETVRAWRRTA